MISAIVAAFLVALVAGEVTDGSRWIAARLARWAAWRIYREDAERAAARAEEWEALISTSLPTSISALCFGMGLAVAAVACVTIRCLGRVVNALRGTGVAPSGAGTAELERRDRVMQRRQTACLELLGTVSQLRLCAAGAARVRARDADLYLAEIRSLVAGVELAAANVAMLAPAAQVAADRLAVASDRLADAMATGRGIDWRRRIRQQWFSELDEAAKAFLRVAVEISTDTTS